MKILGLMTLACALSTGWFAPSLRAESAAERLHESALVLGDLMNAKDNNIPEDLLEGARCVIVIPDAKKAAFVVGGQYGRGFMTCRTRTGSWSAPGAVRMEGGSIGWQIGGAESDIVMLVMNDEGERSLLESKFTLGGNASVAAGPIGRSASARTDGKLTAGILTYSHSHGVFAGISVSGATLRNDLDENKELYGRKLTNREVIAGGVAPTAAARPLLSELSRYTREAKR